MNSEENLSYYEEEWSPKDLLIKKVQNNKDWEKMCPFWLSYWLIFD